MRVRTLIIAVGIFVAGTCMGMALTKGENQAAATISTSSSVGLLAGSTNDSTTEPLTDANVVISGGFSTDPQDHGRPVSLIAAALGVPTEVFREAFSGVTPAGHDRGPTSEQARSNKAALMKVLAPYGISNARLDEVSNYYRYNGSRGEHWRHTPATATAVITDGKLTSVTITNPGSGYSSSPTITITGPQGVVKATATISYTNDFSSNGSITAITLD